jgi:hypothetical protein
MLPNVSGIPGMGFVIIIHIAAIHIGLGFWFPFELLLCAYFAVLIENDYSISQFTPSAENSFMKTNIEKMWH